MLMLLLLLLQLQYDLLVPTRPDGDCLIIAALVLSLPQRLRKSK